MNNITIYTGVWQNHSQSGWRGSTLTLPLGTASLLISALATFITLVGTRFWAIVSFFIHQCRASAQNKDGIHHQHQVIYRNGFSPLATVWLSLQISWAWSNRAHRNVLRFWLAALPPLLTFGGFAAASVLSAKVVISPSAVSQVKLLSKNCGYLDMRNASYIVGTVPQDGSQIFNSWWINSAIVARNYARSCYASTPQNIASCSVFPVTKLPYNTMDTAPCPFGGGRCVLGNDTAFLMQTPWLDSHEHFGINAAPPNRIKWRRRTTCSVLNIKDRISVQPETSGKVYHYHLGYSGTLSSRSNSTYQYSENSANLMIGYTVRPTYAIDRDGSPGWVPIPDLAHIDADVSLFFLSQNAVVYADPVDDPLFSAHKKFDDFPRGSGHTYYGPDEFVTVMACIDQAQIQDPITKFSTPLLGLERLGNETSFIGLNEAQLATALRFIIKSSETLVYNSVNGMGAMALKAQDVLYISVSAGLPKDQWKIELRGWFDTALARMQSAIVEFASKEPGELSKIAKLTLGMYEASTKPMCDNQMVSGVGKYQSFSMMGITIIIAVGLFLVLLSLVLEHIVGFFQTRWGNQAYKQGLWKTDGILQQQRLAFEHDKQREWERTDGTVPVTREGKKWTSIRD